MKKEGRITVGVGAARASSGTPLDQVQAFMRPFPADGMESYPVSTLVNDPKNESAKCMEPLQ